jgi:hypothetical protein
MSEWQLHCIFDSTQRFVFIYVCGLLVELCCAMTKCLSGNCIALLIQHKDSFLYTCVVVSLSYAVL